MPTLVAMAYKYTVGQPYMYPRNDLSYAGNFMRMMFATPCEDYKPNDVLVRADGPHLSSCTPTTSRTRRRRRSACARRPAPTRSPHRRGRRLPVGPAHGGANEACLTCSTTSRRRRRGQDRRVHHQGEGQELAVKLMGFGHRVYKNTIRVRS